MVKLEQKILALLKEVAEKENYEGEIEVKPFSSGGVNYTTQLFLGKLSSAHKEDLNLFIKVPVIGKELRDTMQICDLYRNEIHIYSNIFPVFRTLMETHRIPHDEQLRLPKYYGSSLEYMEEIIILENIDGHTVYDRLESADWEYASLAIKQLAKFHALSFAYKNKYPEDYAAKTDNIVYYFVTKDIREGTRKMLSDSLEICNKILPEDVKIKLKLFYDSYCNGKRWKLTDPNRHPVIAHGDYRASNLLVKYENGSISSLVPTDYQTIHTAPAINDLLYFIFCSTDRKFRDEHLTDLIEHYYRNLCDFMAMLGLDPEVIYARVLFDEDFKECLPYGLYISVLLVPIVTADDTPPPNDMSGGLAVKGSSLFKERFLSIIEEYQEWGIL